jgi:hypothetical protein
MPEPQWVQVLASPSTGAAARLLGSGHVGPVIAELDPGLVHELLAKP